jgi:hypothetical protein
LEEHVAFIFRIKEQAKQDTGKLAVLAYLLHAGFLLGLLYSPEDEGNMFLQNIGWLSMDYMALYPRR